MNLHWELNGLDWHGTSATAAEPALDLYHEGAREEHGDVVSVAYDVIEELTRETHAVLWYSRPHYDLLVVPETDPTGLFTVVLMKSDEVEKVDEGASQMTALRAVIDFCADDHVPVNVVVTDRRFPPFDIEHLDDDDLTNADRSAVMAIGSTLDFISHSWAVFPGPYYHARWHDEYSEDVDEDALRARLKAHYEAEREPVEA